MIERGKDHSNAGAIYAERFSEMLAELETAATQLRVGLLGARAMVGVNTWTGKELRALEERATHIEVLLGKFQAELDGQEYEPPSFELDALPHRGETH